MAAIKISDLNPAGSSFFSDSESYLNELEKEELDIQGGGWFGIVIILTRVAYYSYQIGKQHR